MKTRNFYIVLNYSDEKFDDMVKRIDESGIRPAEMDILGIGHRYIFYGLKDPNDFVKAMPEHKDKKLAAIKIPKSAFGNFPNARITDYFDRGDIVTKLVDFVKADDVLQVAGYKKIRIS